jgi:hypothetical protein
LRIAQAPHGWKQAAVIYSMQLSARKLAESVAASIEHLNVTDFRWLEKASVVNELLLVSPVAFLKS